MPFEPLESKRVYQRAEAIADQVWERVVKWEWFAKKTVGTQLTRAADSIGANVAESAGRFHAADVRNFLYFARGSLLETRYWLRRAHVRGLIPDETFTSLIGELDQLAREINQCIAFQKTRTSSPRPTPEPPNHLTT
jgi:four helix bundle protein